LAYIFEFWLINAGVWLINVRIWLIFFDFAYKCEDLAYIFQFWLINGMGWSFYHELGRKTGLRNGAGPNFFTFHLKNARILRIVLKNT
jgi:hypothetical protein